MLRPVDFCLPALAMKESNEKGTFGRGAEMNGGARGRFGGARGAAGVPESDWTRQILALKPMLRVSRVSRTSTRNPK
jgi:hypothetical protein